jgi:hypothetical protein
MHIVQSDDSDDCFCWEGAGPTVFTLLDSSAVIRIGGSGAAGGGYRNGAVKSVDHVGNAVVPVRAAGGSNHASAVDTAAAQRVGIRQPPCAAPRCAENIEDTEVVDTGHH